MTPVGIHSGLANREQVWWLCQLLCQYMGWGAHQCVRNVPPKLLGIVSTSKLVLFVQHLSTSKVVFTESEQWSTPSHLLIFY